jgi:hypothetical protein
MLFFWPPQHFYIFWESHVKTAIQSPVATLLLAVACSILHAERALALETDFPEIDGQSLFSSTFLIELDAANQAHDPLPKLEAVYRKFSRPAEQAETELTIACVLCQRTGYVNPAEAIKWYDKALVRDLPATALAKQFILRGNMHERLDHHEKALADYVRGLLICLQFNLPDTWPSQDGTGKLQPPPINNADFAGERPAAERLAERERAADYRRESEMIRREQDLLGHRYYYVDAIQRVMKQKRLSEPDLRAIAEKLTNRKDRVDALLRRVRGPNPRPWP